MKKVMDYITINLSLLFFWSLYVTFIGWLEPLIGALCGFTALIGLRCRPQIACFLFGLDEDEWLSARKLE
ncbi:hypothetical protein [Paenibacillus sp. GCM10027626]|uniref:hypothetical protein n=1 Tax=Paenibacillus sp. GCM10027626 TaxID=3273411 RepID=UPI00362C2958